MRWFGLIAVMLFLSLVERVTVMALGLPKENWGVYAAMFAAYLAGGAVVIFFAEPSA